MRHHTTHELRPCEACGRSTKHHITQCHTDTGTHTGNIIRCRECPPDELTAWLVPNGLLLHIVITDDRNVTVANRPLPYGHTGHDSADLALTALGFRRITQWDNEPDTEPNADTCLVRWH